MASTNPLRLPFSAELVPQKKKLNFWAYRSGKELYLPVSTLAKILSARLHRYNKSGSALLKLSHGKSLGLEDKKKTLWMGKTALKLDSVVMYDPGGRELLIPLSAFNHRALQRYTGVAFELENDSQLMVLPLIGIRPPKIESGKGEKKITFDLPRPLKTYEITYYPAGLEAGQKNPVLAVRFPYTEMEKEPAKPAWESRYDEEERELTVRFPLPAHVSMEDIQAERGAFGGGSLTIIYPEAPPVPPAAKITPLPVKRVPPLAKKTTAIRRPLPPTALPKKTEIKAPPVKKTISLRSAPPAPPPPKAVKGPRVIIIDAGHGGKDSGAILPSGIMEKDINLTLAKKVAAQLEKLMPGYKVLLSRRNDIYVDLASRTRLSYRQNPKAFVSIHSNASRSKHRGGYEIYIPASISLDPHAQALASRENTNGRGKNSRSPLNGWELKKHSSVLAQSISLSLSKEIKGRIHNRGIRKGDFYVLRQNGHPAVLIESGFLTHPKDSKYLRNARFQDQFAKGVAQGIAQYLKATAD